MLLAIFLVFLIGITTVSANDLGDVSSNEILKNENVNVVDYSVNEDIDDSVVIGSDDSSASDSGIVNSVENSDSKSNISSNDFNSKSDNLIHNSISEFNESSINDNYVLVDSDDFIISYSYVSNYKEDSYFSSSDFTTQKSSGENFTIKLVDKNNNPLAGREIKLVLKNSLNQTKDYWRTTNFEGIAKLKINLAVPATYYILSYWDGDECYNGVNAISKLVILDKNTNLDKISINNIINAANILKTYVSSKKILPSSILVGGMNCTIAQFSYLLAKATVNINNGNLNDVNFLDVKYPSNSYGDYLDGLLYKNNYLDLANRISAYIQANGQSPNYGTTSLGKSSFELYSFAFAKILSFYGSNGYLPNYCSFESSAVKIANEAYLDTVNPSQFIKGINEINNLNDLTYYLKASGKSAINSAIKNLATSLTSDLTSNWDKASAIFNYVRDSISYSYYANSKYGASGTLAYKKGNCCDQANLIVSLCRSAGLYARYCHGQGCTFSSGLVTGHVWAQIYVDGTWCAADATSYRNKLGDIKNWNVNSFYSLKQYSLLGF